MLVDEPLVLPKYAECPLNGNCKTITLYAQSKKNPSLKSSLTLKTIQLTASSHEPVVRDPL